ncbi:MAG TPA: hypothetical protein VFG63_11830 [Nocardioidaceae bacterium]|nr:hypothetical protein [Nocardioidaceae bacterium]
MYYLMEELAMQREREIAARTRASLFTQQPAGGPLWPARRSRWNRSMGEREGTLRLPALSWGKWRHWAARPHEVHCSRAASIAGAC